MPDPSLPLLFFAAFGAATLLPLQSEGVLVALLLRGMHPVWTLLAVATFANVLGSLVNAMLGRSLLRWRDRRWFPVKRSRPGPRAASVPALRLLVAARELGAGHRRSAHRHRGRDAGAVVAIHAAGVHRQGGTLSAARENGPGRPLRAVPGDIPTVAAPLRLPSRCSRPFLHVYPGFLRVPRFP